jgi:Mg-chelatase subunit ChlD
MNLLRDYVYTFGGGFIMLGGEHSFGQGGYYKTVVEDILPVRCNFDDKKEKSPIAIALVIDRSGSMSGDKIKIAQESAKAAVKLLSPNDFISIIAYDAIPHVIVPTQKASSPDTIRAAINNLVSGGGTNIYNAIQESYEQLNWLNTPSKHVILLTDGKDESDDFESLMKRIAAAGITVTIISIGDNKDDKLLRQIADLGNGRYYQAEDLNSIPQIFINEIMASGKSAIDEIPFVPIIVTKNTILDGITLERIPPLLGFVKTKSKTTSKVILATETGEPLLSWKRYGVGIAAAFTSDVKNRWATEWLTWNEFAKLWSQIIRFVMKQQKLDNAAIECNFADEKIEVKIDITDTTEHFINNATGNLTIITPDLLKQKIPFKQTAAGHYKAAFNTNPKIRGIYQLQMQLQSKERQTILQHSQAMIIDHSKELQKKNINVELLQKIAKLTGGNFNPKPSEILLKQNKPILKIISLRPHLLVTIILLLLLDVFVKRKIKNF